MARDEHVAHVAVIVGRATEEGRDALRTAGAHVQLLVLTERAWQENEAYTRAALLVEEAAIEAGRSALDTPDA
jgi:hypothetical protein